MRLLKRTLFGLFLVVLSLGGLLFWLLERQGLSQEFWKTFSPAKVSFDGHGIPTIEANNWQQLIEAQGYVVASERLWQMDLIRRKAGGRLSEWFGKPAFEQDLRAQLEDRIAVATHGVQDLPASERQYCELYARGVNRFITEQPYRWGLEYILLGIRPEPWACRDSLLVMIEMIDTLTAKAERDSLPALWRHYLPKAWGDFLFTHSHPWNKPLFGDPTPPPALPPEAHHLPQTPLPSLVTASLDVGTGEGAGSNNWAWRGPTGCFLANDPHLSQAVPGIWYASRLRVNAQNWAVGVAIPGVPGITIGMNPHYAWAFTNTGEDIDDYLLETISDDQAQYVQRVYNGKKTWRPIVRKTFSIRVRGESTPRQVVGLFTHRGPLAQHARLGVGYYSRQWLALKPGLLRLPTLQLMQSHSWQEFNAAADQMRLPAQNVITVDTHCNIGLRITGTGIVRPTPDSAGLPSAIAGEWLGLEDPVQRRRLYLPDRQDIAYLATANQRIWVDDSDHSWYGDDRQERIKRYLAARTDFIREDMTALQLDTKSRFRQVLMQWLARHAKPDHAKEADLLKGFLRWDGDSRSHPDYFAMSSLVEGEMVKVLLARAAAAYLPTDLQDLPYMGSMKRAWILPLLARPQAFKVFGSDDHELATYLLKVIMAASRRLPQHHVENRWAGQHPFVAQVPVIGRLFRVTANEQWGAGDLVNAERPKFGPSVRLIWDMRRPAASTWIFPVGQSGLIGSVHYRDMQKLWATGKTLPIFSSVEAKHWGLLN